MGGGGCWGFQGFGCRVVFRHQPCKLWGPPHFWVGDGSVELGLSFGLALIGR